MILREGIEMSGYDWRQDDAPDFASALMSIFRRTGRRVHDDETRADYCELDLLKALDYVFARTPSRL